MGKKIVLDLVFHAQSLNYDQGFGNLQELKKITTWDGFNHILVSRYAIRYSILDMLKETGLWNIAGKSELVLSGSKKNQDTVDSEGSDESNDSEENTESEKKESGVVQMRRDLIYSSDENGNKKIVEYPEFFYFGYLVTDSDNILKKTAPVRISHAISLNPYRNNPLFYANLGVMNRSGHQGSNPINTEEHLDFYIYNITIDIDDLKELRYTHDSIEKSAVELCEKYDISNKSSEVIGFLTKKKDKKFQNNEDGKITNFASKLKIEEKSEFEKEIKKTFSLDSKITEESIILEKNNSPEYFYEKLEQFLKTVFNLKRNIKGRCEDLSPWISVVGLYNNGEFYDIYKDRISVEKTRTYGVEREEITHKEDNKIKPGVTYIREKTEEGLEPTFVIDNLGKQAEIKKDNGNISSVSSGIILYTRGIKVKTKDQDIQSNNDKEDVIKSIISFTKQTDETKG